MSTNKQYISGSSLLADMRSHKLAAALAGLFWLFLFMTTVSKTWFWQVRSEQEIEYGFIFLRALLIWGFAALFIPVIFWLTQKLPLDGNPWRTACNAVFHIFMCLALLPWYVLLYRACIALIYYPTEEFFSFFDVQQLARVIVDLGIIFFCVYGLVMIGVHLRRFYRRYRERQQINAELEAELASANLNVLKNQLRPHFLFNTLHNVNALMHEDARAAGKVIRLLQRLLEQSFNQSSLHTVTLARELKFMNIYLEIENIRFQDRLNIKLNIDPETLDAQVPSLILQPLAENAVRHGISKKMEAGTIYITSGKKNRTLQLVVEDDGPGLPDTKSISDKGIGLSNTRKRLRQMYDNHRFLLTSSGYGGLQVLIEIPFSEEDKF